MARSLLAVLVTLGCGSAPPPATTAVDPCAATPAVCADEASCRTALAHAATERDTLARELALGELLAEGDGAELAALARDVLATDFTCGDAAHAAEATAGWARALHARAQAGEAAAVAPADAVYSAWVTRFPDHPSAAAVLFAHGQLLLYRSDTPERALVPLLLAAERASDPELRASALADAVAAARSASPVDRGARCRGWRSRSRHRTTASASSSPCSPSPSRRVSARSRIGCGLASTTSPRRPPCATRRAS